MPILRESKLSVDYLDDCASPAVVLVHSSVSGNKQWRRLGVNRNCRKRLRAEVTDMRYGFRNWRTAALLVAALILSACAGTDKDAWVELRSGTAISRPIVQIKGT